MDAKVMSFSKDTGKFHSDENESDALSESPNLKEASDKILEFERSNEHHDQEGSQKDPKRSKFVPDKIKSFDQKLTQLQAHD